MGARYRIGQFVQAVLKPGAPPELGDLDGLLTAEQKRLFAAMAVADQQHCWRVARTLADGGHSQPALLQAALLHDCGKSLGHITVWERVAHVLIQRLAPQLVGRLGSAQPDGLGHGLYILAHHSELSAQLAAQTGCSPETVELLRGAGDPALQALLRRTDDTH